MVKNKKCLAVKLSDVVIKLINVKMSIVGILPFMSMINFMLSFEHEKFLPWEPDLCPTCVAKDPNFLRGPREDSDQTGLISRLL